MTDAAPFRPGDLVADRYRVKEVLAPGPFGVVVRAAGEGGEDVAVKLFHARLTAAPDDRARLETALRKASLVSHPHLARPTALGEHRDALYAVRPFIGGMSLRQAMERRRAKRQPFSLGEVEALITQIAAGLEAAHPTLAHGDVKAENVLVEPRAVKLTDLGLGGGLPRLAFVAAHRDRKLLGLLAPEFETTRTPDARTDTYALGVLLGELLCGVRPGPQLPSISRLRPDLPGALEGLYRKALNEDPDARYQTALEFAEELSALAQRAGIQKRQAAATLPDLPAPSPVTRAKPPEVRKPASDDPTRPFDVTMLPDALPLEATDKTQPLDAELIAQAIAAKVAASGGSDARSPSPAATQPGDASALPPESADQSPTLAMPAIPAEYLASHARGPAVRTRRSRGTLGLIVLTLVGLAGGTVGGTVLLQRLRRRPAPAAVTVPAPPAPAQRAPAPPASPVQPPSAPSPSAASPEPGTGMAAPAEPPAIPAATATTPCPDGMHLVKAGAFPMGTEADDPMMGFDERTLSSVEVGAFCIDQYEYPNRQKAPPRTAVSWHDAKQLCEAVGKRLCTEAEWEKACKGPKALRFPYGDTFDPAVCNTETETGDDRPVAAAGAFARCRSGYGVHDLSGNVAEWTASAYAKDGERVQKGGASDRPDYASRCAARRSGPPAQRAPEVGFRCCSDAR